MKASIGHGNFLPWIEAEFGMTARTAQKFMGVTQAYGGKSELSSHLDPTALYELAAPKTPLEVREEIEKMIEADEVVTKVEVARLRSEYEAAKCGKDLGYRYAEEAEQKLTALQSGANKALSFKVSKAAALCSRSANASQDEKGTGVLRPADALRERFWGSSNGGGEAKTH